MAAPVKHTCPDIDKCIKNIRFAIKIAKQGAGKVDLENDSHLDDYFSDIINYIEDAESILENLRKANDALREWGEDLQSEVENMAYKLSEIENKL